MSYDHRIKTANMDLADVFFNRMQKVREASRKLEIKAAVETLKDIKFMIVNLGLNLDIKKSNITQYRVGSDSWGYDAWLVLTDMWDRGDNLDAKTVSMSVWDVTRMDPTSVVKKGDVWTVAMGWGG